MSFGSQYITTAHGQWFAWCMDFACAFKIGYPLTWLSPTTHEDCGALKHAVMDIPVQLNEHVAVTAVGVVAASHIKSTA